jgi:hypothetical protein
MDVSEVRTGRYCANKRLLCLCHPAIAFQRLMRYAGENLEARKTSLCRGDEVSHSRVLVLRHSEIDRPINAQASLPVLHCSRPWHWEHDGLPRMALRQHLRQLEDAISSHNSVEEVAAYVEEAHVIFSW